MFENMTEAYDFKALFAELKNDVPELSEESAKILIKKIFPWLSKSAVLSENKIDDVISAGYPFLEAKLVDVADDINKADNA